MGADGLQVQEAWFWPYERPDSPECIARYSLFCPVFAFGLRRDGKILDRPAKNGLDSGVKILYTCDQYLRSLSGEEGLSS